MLGPRLAAILRCATPPILSAPGLRRYRTSIRTVVKTGQGAGHPNGASDQSGPNFAGRYLLVGAGCLSPDLRATCKTRPFKVNSLRGDDL